MFNCFDHLANVLPEDVRNFHPYFLEGALLALSAHGYSFYGPDPVVRMPTKQDNIVSWYADNSAPSAYTIISKVNRRADLKLSLYSFLYNVLLQNTELNAQLIFTRNNTEIYVDTCIPAEYPMQVFINSYSACVVRYATMLIEAKVFASMWGTKIEKLPNVEPLFKLGAGSFLNTVSDIDKHLSETHELELRPILSPLLLDKEDIADKVANLKQRFALLQESDNPNEEEASKLMTDINFLGSELGLFDFRPLSVKDSCGIVQKVEGEQT